MDTFLAVLTLLPPAVVATLLILNFFQVVGYSDESYLPEVLYCVAIVFTAAALVALVLIHPHPHAVLLVLACMWIICDIVYFERRYGSEYYYNTSDLAFGWVIVLWVIKFVLSLATIGAIVATVLIP